MRGNPGAVNAPIPYRIRVGLLVEPGVAPSEELAATIEHIIDATVEGLFDDESREALRTAKLTRLAFALLTATADSGDLAARIATRSDKVRLDKLFATETERYAGQYRLLPRGSRMPRDPTSGNRNSDPDRRAAVADRKPDHLGTPDLHEELGRFLVDNCDVLIAIRNGSLGQDIGDGARIGIHAGVLSYARSKGRPVIVSGTDPSSLSIVERGHGLNARSLAGIELYNTWHVDAAVARERAQSKIAGLFGDECGDQVPDESRHAVLTFLIPHFIRGELIATHHQTVYFRTGLLVYALSVFAVALLTLGSLVHAFAPFAFALELVLLLVIVIFVRLAHRRRTHTKWIESRFLTERIRHGLFAAACGVEAARYRIPPYMGGSDPPDHWMTMTFDEIWSRLPELTPCDEKSCPLLAAFVRRKWVADQAAHHGRKASSTQRLASRLEMGGLIVFTLAMAAVLGHLLLPFFIHGERAGIVEGGLTFLALVLPASGAALGGYRAHREYSRLAKRSRAMAEGLRDLDSHFEYVRTPVALEALVRRIEDWMVREVQDWLMLMGPSKLEAPLG